MGAKIVVSVQHVGFGEGGGEGEGEGKGRGGGEKRRGKDVP